MKKRMAFGVLLGLILMGVSAHIWIRLGVRHCGFPPVDEPKYQQVIANYRDG